MAQRKVILSADSTCDLGEELKARYDVHYYPFHIILEGQQYQDNVDIHVQEIYQAYYDRKAARHGGHQRGGVCGVLPPLGGPGL